MILGEADLDQVGVEVDRAQLADAVRKSRRVEVRLDRPEAEDQVGRLDHLSDGFVGAAAGVDAAVVGRCLIDGAFAHWSYKGGKARLVDEFVYLFLRLLGMSVSSSA